MNFLSVFIMLIVGVILMSLLSFLWPLIMTILFIVIIVSLIRTAIQANNIRKNAQEDIHRQWNNDQQQNRTNSRNSGGDSDIIDAEYTEEDID